MDTLKFLELFIQTCGTGCLRECANIQSSGFPFGPPGSRGENPLGINAAAYVQSTLTRPQRWCHPRRQPEYCPFRSLGAPAGEWLGRCRWEDAMVPYAVWRGQRSVKCGRYRNQPLGGPHDAVADCRVLLVRVERMAATVPAARW
ncbi:hypothetical protein ACIHCQ_43185 [Streptomyces sp. NPDC052236]|uniref:hypothetical protein n=1 Tax=Streptomyces sp. NPDC052236 TaxID=3365686 RepID=UPI0037D507B3